MPTEELIPMDRWFADHNGSYESPERSIGLLSKTFPSLSFYFQYVCNVWFSAGEAKRGVYDGKRWAETSHKVLESLESVGIKISISGAEHLEGLNGRCVFVGNHMSMCETMILPAIIQPLMEVTFVVKESLIDYPIFKHILRSRNPIAVTRANPREDFKTVMQEGKKRLTDGIAVVVFPQTTRANRFDPEQFNSIGVKLASKAGVPVVPLALKTDAWGNGRWLKDFGKVSPEKTIHFEFGEPMAISGRGDEQQAATIDFIQSRMTQWERS